MRHNFNLAPMEHFKYALMPRLLPFGEFKLCYRPLGLVTWFDSKKHKFGKHNVGSENDNFCNNNFGTDNYNFGNCNFASSLKNTPINNFCKALKLH
jgi:hypothetical protein